MKNNDSEPVLMWATLGLGFFLAEEADSIGHGVMVGAAVQKGKHVLIVRGNVFDDENVLDVIFGDNDCTLPYASASQICINEIREFKNIGILYGRRSKNIIYAVGLEKMQGDSTVTFSDTNTNQTVESKRELFSSVGVAIEVQIHVLTQKRAGLSFQVVGNINKESPYIGATVNLRFGRMK